jgi:hypothetical protein
LIFERIFQICILHSDFESQNPQRQEQSWENKATTQFADSQSPSSSSFNTQNTQKFVAQPQSWQSKTFSFQKLT